MGNLDYFLELGEGRMWLCIKLLKRVKDKIGINVYLFD